MLLFSCPVVRSTRIHAAMQPFVLVLKCIMNRLGTPGFPEATSLSQALLVFHTHALSHIPCCPNGKMFSVYAGRDYITMYCFFYNFFHAPHGKRIKSPAKFQKPLVMAWRIEVCPSECITMETEGYMHSCSSWPTKRFCYLFSVLAW